MTLAEFKAWLEGFKEAMGDAPTPEQWQKVLAKLQGVQPLSSMGQAPYRPTYDPNTCVQSGQVAAVGHFATSQAVVNGRPVGPSD